MSIDISQLEKLLSEKKYEEAGQLMKLAIGEKMTDLERGDAMVGIISMYIEISNQIDERYLEALEEAIISLKKINKAENEAKDIIKINELKKKIDEIN